MKELLMLFYDIFQSANNVRFANIAIMIKLRLTSNAFTFDKISERLLFSEMNLLHSVKKVSQMI